MSCQDEASRNERMESYSSMCAVTDEEFTDPSNVSGDGDTQKYQACREALLFSGIWKAQKKKIEALRSINTMERSIDEYAFAWEGLLLKHMYNGYADIEGLAGLISTCKPSSPLFKLQNTIYHIHSMTPEGTSWHIIRGLYDLVYLKAANGVPVEGEALKYFDHRRFAFNPTTPRSLIRASKTYVFVAALKFFISECFDPSRGITPDTFCMVCRFLAYSDQERDTNSGLNRCQCKPGDHNWLKAFIHDINTKSKMAKFDFYFDPIQEISRLYLRFIASNRFGKQSRPMGMILLQSLSIRWLHYMVLPFDENNKEFQSIMHIPSIMAASRLAVFLEKVLAGRISRIFSLSMGAELSSEDLTADVKVNKVQPEVYCSSMYDGGLSLNSYEEVISPGKITKRMSPITRKVRTVLNDSSLDCPSPDGGVSISSSYKETCDTEPELKAVSEKLESILASQGHRIASEVREILNSIEPAKSGSREPSPERKDPPPAKKDSPTEEKYKCPRYGTPVPDDESLVSYDESLVSDDGSLVSDDESLVSDDRSEMSKPSKESLPLPEKNDVNPGKKDLPPKKTDSCTSCGATAFLCTCSIFYQGPARPTPLLSVYRYRVGSQLTEVDSGVPKDAPRAMYHTDSGGESKRVFGDGAASEVPTRLRHQQPSHLRTTLHSSTELPNVALEKRPEIAEQSVKHCHLRSSVAGSINHDTDKEDYLPKNASVLETARLEQKLSPVNSQPTPPVEKECPDLCADKDNYDELVEEMRRHVESRLANPKPALSVEKKGPDSIVDIEDLADNLQCLNLPSTGSASTKCTLAKLHSRIDCCTESKSPERKVEPQEGRERLTTRKARKARKATSRKARTVRKTTSRKARKARITAMRKTTITAMRKTTTTISQLPPPTTVKKVTQKYFGSPMAMTASNSSLLGLRVDHIVYNMAQGDLGGRKWMCEGVD